MKTLYIRNVPDDVAEALADEASARGTSVNSLALRELSSFARRRRNADVIRSIVPSDVDAQLVVDIIREGRGT